MGETEMSYVMARNTVQTQSVMISFECYGVLEYWDTECEGIDPRPSPNQINHLCAQCHPFQHLTKH